MRKRSAIAGIILAGCFYGTAAGVRYDVPAVEGDATEVLQQVIDAAVAGGAGAEIRLAPGATYHVYRTSATPKLRYISNTTSERENPDNTKYIALYMQGAEGLTLDGNGAKIVTHGELTSFAIEQCEGVTLKNFTLDAADPSVPEFTITESGDRHVRVKVTEPSRYEITADSTFSGRARGGGSPRGWRRCIFPTKR